MRINRARAFKLNYTAKPFATTSAAVTERINFVAA